MFYFFSLAYLTTTVQRIFQPDITLIDYYLSTVRSVSAGMTIYDAFQVRSCWQAGSSGTTAKHY